MAGLQSTFHNTLNIEFPFPNGQIVLLWKSEVLITTTSNKIRDKGYTNKNMLKILLGIQSSSHLCVCAYVCFHVWLCGSQRTTLASSIHKLPSLDFQTVSLIGLGQGRRLWSRTCLPPPPGPGLVHTTTPRLFPWLPRSQTQVLINNAASALSTEPRPALRTDLFLRAPFLKNSFLPIE